MVLRRHAGSSFNELGAGSGAWDSVGRILFLVTSTKQLTTFPPCLHGTETVPTVGMSKDAMCEAVSE